jgi:HEAT repeat protein
LIILLPWCDDAQSPPALQLMERCKVVLPSRQSGFWIDDETQSELLPLPGWQRWLLAHRCATILSEDKDISLSTLAIAFADRLNESGRPAAAALGTVVAGQDTALAQFATRALGNFGPAAADAVPALTARVKNRSQSYDMLAVSSLTVIGRIGSQAADCVPVLIDVVRSGQSLYVDGAIRALGRIGPRAHDAVPDLVRIVTESRPNCAEAVKALGSIGLNTPEAANAVIIALFEDDTSVRDAAVVALNKHLEVRDQAIAAARMRLNDENFSTRIFAALGLLALGPAASPAAQDLEDRMASDSHRLVRAAAAQALGCIRSNDPNTLQAIELAANSDPDASVRAMAAATLQMIEQRRTARQ